VDILCGTLLIIGSVSFVRLLSVLYVVCHFLKSNGLFTRRRQLTCFQLTYLFRVAKTIFLHCDLI
jgi:hypothetical protein